MSNAEIVKTELETQLGQLAEVQAIVVSDKESCRLAKEGQATVRAYIKDVNFKLGPFVEYAKVNLNKARADLARWLEPAEAIDRALAQKVKDWERQERIAAEAEQRRVNEERRKTAEAAAEAERKERERAIDAQVKYGGMGKREAKKQLAQAANEAAQQVAAVQDVVVKPDIPTVAGVPSRQDWHYRIVNPELIPPAFRMIDMLGIGQMVRREKDKEKAEKLCPGIEVWRD
jgi:hypothetical protein